MNDTVSNNAAQHRFELAVDGHIAAAYYEKSGDVITFEHTEVPAELGGKGIGSKLVKGALPEIPRIPAIEIMFCNPLVRKMIHEGDDRKLPDAIRAGRPASIPFQEIVAGTRATFALRASVAVGDAVALPVPLGDAAGAPASA